MPRLKTKKNRVDVNQQTINDWMEKTGSTDIDMREVARWAIKNGRWRPPNFDPVKACAAELSRAAREEHYTDPQGREVRKKHCYVYTDEEGQRRWRWMDITTAQPDSMRMAFQQRRQSALGDIVQLDRDVQSYNDNNKFGVQLKLDYDFNEDLAELSQPVEYP